MPYLITYSLLPPRNGYFYFSYGIHSHLFPKGGAYVPSVIRFQDDWRRSAVVSAEVQKWSSTPKCIDKC